MSQTGPRRYVLCYDISDEKRLRKIHRRVREDGIALQFSVFDCILKAKHLQRLIRDIRAIIDPRLDDVRIYGPRVEAPIIWLGTPPLPDGVQLFNNSSAHANNLSGGPVIQKPSLLLPSLLRQAASKLPDKKGFSR